MDPRTLIEALAGDRAAANAAVYQALRENDWETVYAVSQMMLRKADLEMGEGDIIPTWVRGSLSFQPGLKTTPRLPEGLRVSGDFYGAGCTDEELPMGLFVGGNLILRECAVRRVASQTLVGGDLVISTKGDVDLGDRLEVRGSLYCSGARVLNMLGVQHVGKHVHISDCGVLNFPMYHVRGDLSLTRCRMYFLTSDLQVQGSVDLAGTQVDDRCIPRGFKCGGDLNLTDSNVFELWSGSEVGGKIISSFGEFDTAAEFNKAAAYA